MSKLADMMARAVEEDNASESEAAAPTGETSDAPAPSEGDAAAGAATSAPEQPARGPDGKFLPKDKAEAKAEPPKAEAPKPAEDEEAKKRAAEESRRASQFAALSRKVQEVRSAEARVQEREKQLTTREERVTAWEKAIDTSWERTADGNQAFFDMLEKRGITADDIIERARTMGTPEARVKQTNSAWQKERDEMRAEIKALREGLEKDKIGAIEAENSEAASAFAAFLEDDPDGKYAATAIYSAREAVDLANQIAAEAQERAKYEPEFRGWGFDKIAEALNKLALQDGRYKKLVGRQQQQAPSLLEKAASQDAPKAAADKEQGQQGPKATTLTNQQASERASGARDRVSHKDRVARLMARSD